MPQFQIIIVGAGIAGLSTAIALRRKGHDITVLERHAGCQALGGPVGLSPNATRVLIEYGMEDIMRAADTRRHRSIYQRRYADGSILSATTVDATRAAYGFTSWLPSRYKLQGILAKVAEEQGVNILFDSPVASVHQDTPVILLKDGTKFEADLIVGADGFRSVVRDVVVEEKVQSISPFSAYNIDIPRKLLEDDLDLAHLLHESNFWLGPSRVCTGFNMQDHGDKLNLCLVSEEPEGKEGEWYTIGDLKKVKAKFSDFEPNVRKLLELADPKNCYIWRLSEMPPLKTWVSESGKVVIAGDAVHAMLPYSNMVQYFLPICTTLFLKFT
jgi:salicylate hydroxylase